MDNYYVEITMAFVSPPKILTTNFDASMAVIVSH